MKLHEFKDKYLLIGEYQELQLMKMNEVILK